MRYPTLAASPHPPFDISGFTPTGVNIVNNMMLARFHRGPSALTYAWFYKQVRGHGPWDYKQRGRQFENFGNFHYGAVGHAAGIPDAVLLRGAGWAQNRAGTSNAEFGDWYGSSPYGDDPDDQAWIKMGINYAQRSGF
ncbi:polymorphic toxin type 44 domain-containing protein [Scandinavium sp. V105_16]|uniref:Polymorphic toxin type 44 domain-containing protein n=1 Tax=Scandinavium lactucae TaxID=3095028 RepID=A0AAJ2VT47_9ENTR|nr:MULTISPECIES: polymorphic toxin type 44 domain-containing protein [unclassified Scandinavium]MDX6020933.1 polymorphic toxin type 44 domain-containing protein [Scandinavium sp. V105_16]MDX6032530.1 polymorphic toxin type 44 domain-containing protein [Scandinavium sp. V105_12]